MESKPAYGDERTRDVYEILPGYPQPPLIPLPDPADLSSLERIGIRMDGVSERVIRTALALVGYGRFRRALPDHFEETLRRTNMRLPGLQSLPISATIALADDPRTLTPIQRAVTLLYAARELYDDLASGKLVPDMLGDQPLEMGQYPNLFATSLIVEGGDARLFKSTTLDHITVAVSRRFYRVPLGDLGDKSGQAAPKLVASLRALADRARRDPLRSDEMAPGLLTCASNETQLRAFKRLYRNPVNQEALQALRHSFLFLCLDLDSYPASDADAALFAHAANPANRWYHASLQIVVFGNAKACAICNFTAYLDGNTMMRGAAEIQRRATRVSLPPDPSAADGDLLQGTRLNWRIGSRDLRQARRELRLQLDTQQATFELPGYGTEWFAVQQLPAVPAFVASLQMAARTLTGRHPRITQFLAMSKYRCMDLETVMVTTPEMIRFVDYMEGGEVEPEQARYLLARATESQAREARLARRQFHVPLILGLLARSRTGLSRQYVFAVEAVAMGILRLLRRLQRQPREILISHPAIYPETPLVGRPGARLPYVTCFGLHYQIFPDKAVITVMPGYLWTIPNAELVAELQASLDRMNSRLGFGQTSASIEL